MLNAALALLDDIQAAIASEPCQPDVIRVTAGEPAAPNPGCVDVAVWVDNIADANAFSQGCLVRSRLRLAYRIGWCYTESAEGPSDDDELAASDCLYGLMEAVWCHFVAERGSLAGATQCDDVQIEPMSVQPRSGGWVAASGFVTVPFDCVASAS